MSKSDGIKVSIICNAFNHEQYIRQTLDGFLRQRTNFPFEILIHDDASTDATAQIIREYESKYPDLIRPIYQTVNQYSQGIKISSAYQYPRARGEYIAFCEGDDYWISPDKLQLQVDILDNNRDYVACVHRYQVVDKTGEPRTVKTFGEYEQPGVYSFWDFEKKELPSQLATLVCRNIFSTEGMCYPEKLAQIKLNGDIKLFLHLLHYGDIYRMGEVMSAYRFVTEVGGGSWSSMQLRKAVGYKDWNALRQLERYCRDEFGRPLNLRERRVRAAVRTVKDFARQKNWANFCHAAEVILKQRGLLSEMFGKILGKVHGK